VVVFLAFRYVALAFALALGVVALLTSLIIGPGLKFTKIAIVSQL